jgi:hypothetical protein
VVLPTGAISDDCLRNAVWNATLALYSGTTGSTAEALNAVPKTSPIIPTVEQIDAQLSSTHGIGLWLSYVLDQEDGSVSQAQLDALLLAFGALAAGMYPGGSVNNPNIVQWNKDIVLFADTDQDNIEFNVGPQWSTYLNEADSVPWFTVKSDPRQTASIIDASASITDADTGSISLSLSSAQMDVKEGTFFWQLKLVRTITTQPAGDPAPTPVISYKKRMLMEGKVYIKPTFKV